jgi:hypothetical protein
MLTALGAAHRHTTEAHSYSHPDKRFVDELMVHLALLARKFKFEVWSDQKLTGGDLWRSEIEAALARTDIALLCVSADYLASEWIATVELPKVIGQVKEGRTRVIPIIVRPSTWAHTPLAYLQAFPRDAQPLSEMTEARRDRAWTDLTEVLEAELYRLRASHESALPATDRRGVGSPPAPDELIDGPKRAGAPRDPDEERRASFFISHAKEDGDFAENLSGRLREAGFDGWIDVDVLEAGIDWRKEIDEAILESRAVILVLSPHSKSSEYVTYEWAFALGSGLRVVPLMLRDTPIHPRLEIFQYLDFTNRRARPWDRLLALLRDISRSAPNHRLQKTKANSG